MPTKNLFFCLFLTEGTLITLFKDNKRRIRIRTNKYGSLWPKPYRSGIYSRVPGINVPSLRLGAGNHKDPDQDPYLCLKDPDPDPGGPNTYGSGFGPASTTLLRSSVSSRDSKGLVLVPTGTSNSVRGLDIPCAECQRDFYAAILHI
jgi:hypothetical protein